MNTETITAQFVDPPKPGKKLWGVKSSDGRRFGFDPSRVSIQQGGTYTVQVSSRDWQGKTYYNIEGVVNGGGGSGAAPAQQATPRGAKYGAADDATAERIYCCGIVNAAVSGGQLTLSTASLVAATNAARAAWAQTFGGKAHDERADQMPDSDTPF